MIMRTRVLLLVIAVAPLGAQWLNYPTAGIPRTPDGKPDLTAPAPKTADGKPDIGGLWQPPPGSVANIAKDLKPEEISFQPAAAALYKQRQDTLSKDDPTGNCIPGGVPRSDLVGYPFKIVPAPGMVMILYEAVHSYRQIFTDGRVLPKEFSPSWMGNSVGRWEDDTFVVESTGFKENSWLDNGGHPGTEALHVIERFHRKDFGHLDLRITVDDPRSYTKPFTASYVLSLQPDTELLEYVCNENNKDLEHLVGK
jgi:hypothetical protein